MRQRHAVAIRSIADASHQIAELIKAIEFASRGFKPFSYSYFFTERDGKRVGPVTGVIWAESAKNAHRLVAIDRNGDQYGVDIEIVASQWDEEERRKCATPECMNDPGGNALEDDYLFCDICTRLNEYTTRLERMSKIVAL
jgi:hypothetical protein